MASLLASRSHGNKLGLFLNLSFILLLSFYLTNNLHQSKKKSTLHQILSASNNDETCTHIERFHDQKSKCDYVFLVKPKQIISLDIEKNKTQAHPPHVYTSHTTQTQTHFRRNPALALSFLEYTKKKAPYLLRLYSQSHRGREKKVPLSIMAYISMGEAHRRITEYLNRFSDSIYSQDASSLKHLLSISSNSSSLLSLADALNVFQDANRLIKQSDRYAQYGEIIAPLLRCLQSYRTDHLVDAYNAFEKSANVFLQEFRNWESAWGIEAMYTISYEIRVLAERADRELASVGKTPEKLKGAGSFLMKVFGALAGKGPKRIGALYVTCQLFKVYFKLGTVHLCRSVIRSIETARIFDFEEFPVRDKVTYMYYTGRLEVYNENFLAADQKLTYALMHCNPQSEANIRMILKYLIPVKLSIGIVPKRMLLEKYNLIEYRDVVQALKRGDLRLLRHALQEHENEFLRSGVYLVLEKLELQVYQRLVKKIYVIQKQKDPTKAHQVKLDVIVKALKWLQMDMDVDEVECIMAILIYKNLVKGYFAHKSKVAVLSKQDPFPKLNGRAVDS